MDGGRKSVNPEPFARGMDESLRNLSHALSYQGARRRYSEPTEKAGAEGQPRWGPRREGVLMASALSALTFPWQN